MISWLEVMLDCQAPYRAIMKLRSIPGPGKLSAKALSGMLFELSTSENRIPALSLCAAAYNSIVVIFFGGIMNLILVTLCVAKG